MAGQPISDVYTQFTTAQFLAAGGSTNISFALRDDPAFISLDDITVKDVTTNTAVPVVNGGFESGPLGANQPTGWTYLNTFGAGAAGTVQNSPGGAHSGSNYYFDGAIQAYDGITQAIATTPGNLYTISFWISTDQTQAFYQDVSTNGQPGTGGNGIDLLVFGGAIPTAVPEPASMMMLGTGLAFVGILYSRPRKVA